MMKKMKGIALVLLILMVGSASSGAAHADIVNLLAADLVTVDNSEYELVTDMPPDGAGLMWEPNGSGGYKACICRMVAFRALQAVGEHVGIDDFASANTSILTGWNTDGPEELYVDNMPWVAGSNFAYADSITANAQLDLADAWYDYTIGGTTYRVESLAGNYEFDAETSHAGYHDGWDFFDYRTFVKEGGTGAAKDYFSSVVRPQIVGNFEGATSFEVTVVPLPGAAWLFASGILGFAGLRRKSFCS